MFRCLKPQCSATCSDCNHALPETDAEAMLVVDLLHALAVDGFGGPLEDGENHVVDRARAWLANRRHAAAAQVGATTPLQALWLQLGQAMMRIDAVVLLAGMLDVGGDLADPLEDLLAGEPRRLKECFPAMPDEIAAIEEFGDFKAAFLRWAADSQLLGYALCFARPVITWRADGHIKNACWSHYATVWLYGETLDEAVARGMAWAKVREADERAMVGLAAA